MTMKETITDKLDRSLAPQHLEVRNESHMHNVPPGSESHFRLLVVSSEFEGHSRIERHRAIHRLLADELAAGLHALAVDAFTPGEWERRGRQGGASPLCHGGEKRH